MSWVAMLPMAVFAETLNKRRDDNMLETKKDDKTPRYHQPDNYPKSCDTTDRALKDFKKVEKK